ncbi:MAG TPA: response regulator [Gemmatimonadales bacterium]|jgi:CheY-like chemotaxis protein|nr:response regulator [Gemmatimonadales bacterium]
MANILVVEDSPDNMKLVTTVLRLKGHTVHEMTDGEGLLARLEETRPELVLMDIQLPGKDGFALLAEIRGSPQAGLRVVALTAHAMSGDRDRALESGFDGYITKPIDVRRFPEQVARVLGGELVTD